MPPLPLYPNQPVGAPDIAAHPGWGGANLGSSGSGSGRMRVYDSPDGPVLIPENLADEDIESYVKLYQHQNSVLREMWAASSGFEREKLAAQIKSSDKALENAMAIAELQGQNSRYGVDIQRQTALDQLKENARQFDAQHFLDQQEFGLKYAVAETEYLSSPDTMFQARQLSRSANAALGSMAAPSYRGYGDSEQGRTSDQFKALSTYGGGGQGAFEGTSQPGLNAPPVRGGGYSAVATPGGQPLGPAAGGQAAPGGGAPRQLNISGGQAQAGAAAPVTPTDPRATAAQAVLKAFPPSAGAGHTARDFAALNAVQSVYSAPAEGADMDAAEVAAGKVLARGPAQFGLGEYESFSPGAKGALGSLARTKGIYMKDWDAAHARSRPGQTSALAG